MPAPAADLVALLSAHREPPSSIDVDRLRRQRHERLQAEMARQGVDAALLLHGPNLSYATGRALSAVDVSHAAFQRPVAVVVAGDEQPHLLEEVWPELDEGAASLARRLDEFAGPLAGRRIAVDEQTGAMLRAGVLKDVDVADATHLVAAAKIVKTPDELACISEAQRRNEAAMLEAQAALVPGATRAQVAAAFLARLSEVGVDANMIDPIFQPMPRRLVDGPRTTNGAVAFPTGVGNPTFVDGDLVWVDSGIDHLGYASDFGRTWVVGRDPEPVEQRCFERWCEVMLAVLAELRPGVSAGALCRAAEHANGGERPWLAHFYLAHGVGVESAEMPLIGTDLGAEFDDSLLLAPGMVLVLEPVIWEDGAGGYRSEEIVALTDDGWTHLGGGHPYTPFAA